MLIRTANLSILLAGDLDAEGSHRETVSGSAQSSDNERWDTLLPTLRKPQVFRLHFLRQDFQLSSEGFPSKATALYKSYMLSGPY